MTDQTYKTERLKGAERLILTLMRFPEEKQELAALMGTAYLCGLESGFEKKQGDGSVRKCAVK
jgi:hypothetical protein